MEARHKILIVDDDADWLSLCRDLLSNLQSGPEILTATNAKRALDIMETEQIRLLISDLKMPRIDGLQVLRWIRQQPGLKALRVVVLTASTEMHDATLAYQAGANSFLVKTIDFEEFVNITNAIQGYWLWTSKSPEVVRPERTKNRS